MDSRNTDNHRTCVNYAVEISRDTQGHTERTQKPAIRIGCQGGPINDEITLISVKFDADLNTYKP